MSFGCSLGRAESLRGAFATKDAPTETRGTLRMHKGITGCQAGATTLHFSKAMLSTTTVPLSSLHFSQNTPTVTDVNFLRTSAFRSRCGAHSG